MGNCGEYVVRLPPIHNESHQAAAYTHKRVATVVYEKLSKIHDNLLPPFHLCILQRQRLLAYLIVLPNTVVAVVDVDTLCTYDISIE